MNPAALCDKCSQLGITQNSFVIRAAKPVSLQDPVTLRSRERDASGKPPQVLRSGQSRTELGSLSQVISRAPECRLCALIVKAIRRYDSEESSEAHTFCSIRWELDGHEELKHRQFLNRTRRLRLTWGPLSEKSTHSRKEAFLLHVATERFTGPSAVYSENYRTDRMFQGREIDQKAGKQGLIMSWLDLCGKHGQDCSAELISEKALRPLLDETFFGVVDVADLKLTPLPRDNNGRASPYVALSYVWGNTDPDYRTTRSNVPWRVQQGGLEHDLNKFPKTIQDAIRLVQRLNLRYLWIDALCIVQDSATSFKLNAASMHTIYGNAYFTICAADGDASTGLRAMSESVPDLNVHDEEMLQIGERIIPGLKLQVTRPPEMVIQDSEWDTRGWTFQERILSRRCVIFAEQRIYFQCRLLSLSEDVHNETLGFGYSLQSMGAPMRDLAEIKTRAIWFYMRSVSMFYGRSLSKESDILFAYKGMESVLQRVMHGRFCFGLPTSHFDLALLWQPLKAIHRRDPTRGKRSSPCKDSECKRCESCAGATPLETQEFPSWSWSGWKGGAVAYDQSTLDGVLLDVKSWLARHTFIRWHICDGKARIRPLWKWNRVLEDESREERWKGYRGLRREDVEDVEEVEEDRREAVDDDRDYEDDQPGLGRVTYERNEYRYIDDEIDPRERPRPYNQHVEQVSEQVYRRIRRQSTLTEERKPPSTESSQSPSQKPSLYRRRDRNPTDDWGRDTTSIAADNDPPEFALINAENPYGVLQAPFTQEDLAELPLLQFWAQHSVLHIVPATTDSETQLSRCHIADENNDWCGTVVLNTDWVDSRQADMKCDFIEISHAKAFTFEELATWTYYVPKERSESEWDVSYALLVEYRHRKHVWERVGLAKIFTAAFRGGRRKEFILG